MSKKNQALKIIRPTSRDTSKESLNNTRVGLAYLREFLPPGFSRYFRVRRAGKYWGLTVECPVCEAKPPQELKHGHRRWRWLAAHMMKHEKTVPLRR